jgi:TrmH family RNA methyltransferase
MVSLSKNQISHLRKLHQKKFRQERLQYIVEGVRPVEHVYNHHQADIQWIVVQEGTVFPAWLSDSDTVFVTDKKTFSELSDTQTPQGILALCNQPEPVAETITGPIIALDGLQDPGNVGTIIRSLIWFGGNQLLVSKQTADVFSLKTARSAAGASADIHVQEIVFPEGLIAYEKQGWSVTILDAVPGSTSLFEVSFSPKTIFVVGNEGNGPGNWTEKTTFKSVKIPGTGIPESLNAAVSVSIALSHWKRFASSNL